MDPQTHIIKNQEVQLFLKDQPEFVDLQNEVSDLMYSRVLPQLESVFDQLIDPDMVVRLDRLEIDLGTIRRDHLEKEFLERLIEEIKLALKEKLNDIQFDVSLNQVLDQGHITRSGDLRDAIRQNPDQCSMELFFSFLKTGYFPWWAPKLSGAELDRGMRQSIRRASNDSITYIKRQLKDQVTRRRLVQQFSTTLLELVIEKLAGKDHRVLVEYLNNFKSVMNQILHRHTWAASKIWLWETLLAEVIVDNDITRITKKLSGIWIHHLSKKYPQSVEPLYLTLIQKQQSENSEQLRLFWGACISIVLKLNFDLRKMHKIHPEEQDITESKTKLADQKAPGKPKSVPESFSDTKSKTSRRQTDQIDEPGASDHSPDQGRKEDLEIKSKTAKKDKGREIKTSQETTSQKLKQTRTLGPEKVKFELPSVDELITIVEQEVHRPSPEEIYIQNAGLVLFGVYLPGLFEKLRWIDNDQLLEPERAVHLLQYMTSTEPEPAEYLLPLNKLLCGLAMRIPLKKIKLRKSERQVANGLMKAVIRNWSALKHTSPDGLREGFIQREGKLTQKESNDWHLAVEHKSVDILMQKLPWSISVIKLPWMQSTIYVDWV